MAIVDLICPRCGAQMKLAGKYLQCSYCGYTALYDNEEPSVADKKTNEKESVFTIDFPSIAFIRICKKVAAKYPAIESVNVVGSSAICYVNGRDKNSWKFSLELCDIPNRVYQVVSEKSFSVLPKKYAKNVLREIETFRNEYTKNWHETDCPNCKSKMIQRSKSDEWRCTNCGCTLPANALEEDSDFIMWFCDNCGQFLNMQKGFSESNKRWRCRSCGFVNNVDPNDPSSIVD